MESIGVLQMTVTILGLSFLPFVFVAVTCFTKIVIVLFIIRNALGIQQALPNLVIYGITFLLTVFIWFPVLQEVLTSVSAASPDFGQVEGWGSMLSDAQEPIKDYMRRHIRDNEHLFFIDSATRMWDVSKVDGELTDHILVLTAAHLASELASAFEIGFLLYLPFVTIDLIVSNILLSMGSMMISPIMISLPIKLFLFIAVDGWSRLLHSLVLGYAS